MAAWVVPSAVASSPRSMSATVGSGLRGGGGSAADDVTVGGARSFVSDDAVTDTAVTDAAAVIADAAGIDAP